MTSSGDFSPVTGDTRTPDEDATATPGGAQEDEEDEDATTSPLDEYYEDEEDVDDALLFADDALGLMIDGSLEELDTPGHESYVHHAEDTQDDVTQDDVTQVREEL